MVYEYGKYQKMGKASKSHLSVGCSFEWPQNNQVFPTFYIENRILEWKCGKTINNPYMYTIGIMS